MLCHYRYSCLSAFLLFFVPIGVTYLAIVYQPESQNFAGRHRLSDLYFEYFTCGFKFINVLRHWKVISACLYFESFVCLP